MARSTANHRSILLTFPVKSPPGLATVFDLFAANPVRRIAAADTGFGRDLSCSVKGLIWTEQYCSAKSRDMDQYSPAQGDLSGPGPKVNPITVFLAIGCVAVGAVLVNEP